MIRHARPSGESAGPRLIGVDAETAGLYNSYVNISSGGPTDADQGAILAWIASGYRLESTLERALEAHSLSLPKLNVLTYLAESRQSLALSEIAARLNCVRSNVTQLVDRLEADGLVRRLYDPADRRTVRAELTDLGRQRQAAGSQTLAKATNDLIAKLSEADLAVVGRLVKAMK